MSVSSLLAKIFLFVPKATLIRTAAKAFATYVLPFASSNADIRTMLVELVNAIVKADPTILETVAAAAAEGK